MKKAFTQTLMELRGGAVVEEATNELNTLVAMVRDTGKAGKITITVEVKPFAKVQDALEVTGKVVEFSGTPPTSEADRKAATDY